MKLKNAGCKLGRNYLPVPRVYPAFRDGDRELFAEFLSSVRAFDEDQVKHRMDRGSKLGITGVHAQALYLAALHKVAHERELDCPIIIDTTGRIISFRE